MTALPAHSPLGASGSHRWLHCPASVGLSWGIEDEESDHAKEGTAAHALAELCLRQGFDAWQWVGCEIEEIEVTKDMADAVQVYLNYVRNNFPDRHQGNTFIERRFHCPTLHPLFFGTNDFAFLDLEERSLHIIDYKHGAGIVVEAPNNPQLMYYAAGILEDVGLWNAVDTVKLTICQPRGWHFDGPIRTWETTAEAIDIWLGDVLLPGMKLTETSDKTASDEHCRFCPARLAACPQLVEDWKELEKLMLDLSKKASPDWTNEQVAKFKDLFERAKISAKALDSVAYNRLNRGEKIPGYKLAEGRAHREWKAGADKALKKQFGDDAWAPDTLRSPAQIDELPKGEAFTARWAQKPKGKLTVVKADDNRPEVSGSTKSAFKAVPKGKKEK